MIVIPNIETLHSTILRTLDPLGDPRRPRELSEGSLSSPPAFWQSTARSYLFLGGRGLVGFRVLGLGFWV